MALKESDSGRRLTYSQLIYAINRTAGGLTRAGLKPGDHVLFGVRPGIDAFVLLLALQRLGAVLVALEPGTGRILFERRLALLDVRCVIAESIVFALAALADHPSAARLVRACGLELPFPDLNAVRGPRRIYVRVGGWLPGVPRGPSLHTLRSCTPAALPMQSPREDDPLFVVFTSGTTDLPKAVVHTHGSVAATVELLSRYVDLNNSSVVYSNELHLILPTLKAGGTVVIPPWRVQSARAVLHDSVKHNVTHIFGLPSHFERLLDYWRRTGRRFPASLRVILLGSATVDTCFLERFRHIVSPRTSVWCVYGMTEMVPVSCVSLEEKLNFRGVGDLVGQPLPEVSVRLADDGELLVCGPHLFRGYLGGVPVKEHATGDLASIDGFGRLILRGRKKDMILRGGHNVYPGLFEPVICRIAGVKRCAMIGVHAPDRSDEQIVLAVEPQPGEDRARLRRRLARALRSGPFCIDTVAQPDRIVIVGRLPVAGRSDEIDRASLRDLLTRNSGCG
jgi:acyl-CoA synthetase (AMP-forming)/AMP-acid ligase II